MTDNKLSSYALYAVGEIVLVVIGILIALQINNWNESKKSQVKEGFLIDHMISDAEADSLFFQTRIDVLQKQDSILDYVLFINQFPLADTTTDLRAEHRILPYVGFVLLSEVLDNYEYSQENVGSWSIKQRLQELKKSYHYLEYDFMLYSEELQEKVLPLDQNSHRIFRDASPTATLDEFRQIFINPELEITFASLRNRSDNAMEELHTIIPINQALLQELREYKKTLSE